MREKYAPTIKLYCMITNTEIVLHSVKYDLRRISFNRTYTTFTVWNRPVDWKRDQTEHKRSNLEGQTFFS